MPRHGPSVRANQFFKLDGLVEMVTRRVSEDFNGFLANRLVEVLCVTRFFVVMPPFPRLFGAQHETDGGGGAIN